MASSSLKVFTLSKTWERQTCRHSAYDASSTSPPSLDSLELFLQMFCTAAWLMWVQHQKLRLTTAAKLLQSPNRTAHAQFSTQVLRQSQRCSFVELPSSCNKFPHTCSGKASDEKKGASIGLPRQGDQLVAIPQSARICQAFQTKLMQQNVRQRHKWMRVQL
jgi:hypothetical protein